MSDQSGFVQVLANWASDAIAWTNTHPQYVTVVLLVAAAGSIALAWRFRRRRQALPLLLVAGGPSQAMGIKFDEIGAADFGFGTLDRKYTIVVWLVDERGRPLRGGRRIRMSLRSKKSNFASNSVEFDENDLIQMGVSPRRVEKGGMEKAEWPERVNVLAHEVSQWSPATLWSHPEPGLRWSFRLAVIFAIIAFTLERMWEVIRSLFSA